MNRRAIHALDLAFEGKDAKGIWRQGQGVIKQGTDTQIVRGMRQPLVNHEGSTELGQQESGHTKEEGGGI